MPSIPSIRLCILLGCLALTGVSWSQTGPARIRRFASADTIILDSLSIFPGRLVILHQGDTLSDSLFTVNYAHASIVFNGQPPADSITAVYQAMPFRIASEIAHKRTEDYLTVSGRPINRYRIGQGAASEILFQEDGITKSGSISRGVAFGNAQNLSVNSSLNLQLSGRISDKYNLLASVSDDNIPIQPEGNSQQLQDFDQVFIQVFDDRNKLIAGDFILRRPSGYFMNYFKRAQGAYVSLSGLTLNDAKRPVQLTAEASASVSKGRFARNVIQGIEGNQGPYRLTGDNNELFIVVLAGTEAVYIDGRLMERGQDKDYTVDYNAAEIIFTPRQLITKDRRITVEFQYSDKRFARPLLTSSIVATTPRASYHFNFFSENDARNQPLQQELTDSDKRILAGAGDNPLRAVTSGADSVGYSNVNVLYALRDSLGFDTVYVYSVHPDSALYRVTFTFVGNGNGDYVEDGFTANGRKFRWVLPETAGNELLRKGSYAPVTVLFAPQKKQMITAGINWRSGERKDAGHFIQSEAAMSINDLNTFSSIDSGDDQGYGVRTTYAWRKAASAPRDSTSRTIVGWEIASTYEYTSRDFSRVERFRDVEFERNWNVLQLDLRNDQHIASAVLTADIPGAGKAGLGADLFIIGENYTGRKAQAFTRIQNRKGTRAIFNGSILESSGQINSSFIRHKSDLAQTWKGARIGFRDEHEHNRVFTQSRDSLTAASYRFHDWEVSLGNADTTKRQISVFYRDRWEERPSVTLSRASRADHYGVVMGITGSAGNRIRLQAFNRRLRITDPELISQQPENTLLLRGEYSFRWWKGLLQGTSFYEVGSGLEQRREFIYLEVPAGQGNFVWIDYNNDGVRDLNEFEVAQFAYEANFIRSFVQTNEYVKTYSNQFSQTLWITPGQWWKSPDKSVEKLLSRFSNQTSYRIDRKTQQEGPGDRLNPFLTSISDTALLSLNGSFRNVLFFNKSNPKFGADVTVQQVSGKSLLSSGFESRSDQFRQLGLRWNLLRDITLLLEARSGDKQVASDVLAGRNYRIEQIALRPRVNWQPSVTARLGVFGEYSEKTNNPNAGGESAILRKAGLEWTASSPEKGLATANFQVVSIAYTGAGNNSLSFDMLEGLAPGVNLTWGAGIQRTVAKNLQLNLQYNGRKPEELKTIHSGGVQIRAFF